MLQRLIPGTSELLPVVGLGTWIQFDVSSEEEKKPLREILKRLAIEKNSMIDSSPMYGKSESVIGELTKELNVEDELFFATKVWTNGKQAGIKQIEDSFLKMRCKVIDLIQVHNLVDWETHFNTLLQLKEQGRIRYTGISHYTNESHEELERVIKKVKPDFVQFNYSIRQRHADKSLFNVAHEYGVAIIINMPFENGKLFRSVEGKQLSPWAKEAGIKNWSQYFLKFIISHPFVNCVIPGTSVLNNLLSNIESAEGFIPNENERETMAKEFISRI